MSKLVKRNTVYIDDKPFVYVDNTRPDVKQTHHQGQPEVLDRADNIIVKAEKQAEDIIRKALADAAEIEKEGYVKGYNKGQSDAEKENEIELERIKAIITRLDEKAENFLEKTKQSVVELAMTIAEKVVCQKLSSDKSIFIKLYENAVKDLTAQRWIKLTVGKHDFEIGTANSKYLVETVSGAERVEIIVLDDAPQGTCIVETSEKIVDASIKTQFQILKNAVM